MIKILITGAGSLIGQGIIKTIEKMNGSYSIFGADYFNDAVGLYWTKKSFILPDILKKESNIKIWEKKILKIIKENKINIVIPGLDFELKLFADLKKKIETSSSCKVIVSNREIINTFHDKWLTVNYLKKNKFPYPNSTLISGLKKFLKKNKFPLIVKPRVGSTSRNVFLVHNSKELKKALKYCPNPIVQEYLFKNNNEYTCGTISHNQKTISSIVLKRKLKQGNTIKATYENNSKTKKINNYLIQLSNKIKPLGPLNFQLCLKKGIPVIFEVNPRFSGTTPLRNIFGVNEVDTIIRAIMNKPNIVKKNFKCGTIIRYFENYFIKKEKSFL
jgi:carbamoyl-phosphate synthase large subunit